MSSMNISPRETAQRTVVVIGGGPAGMMAAITAARIGGKVVLLERNSRLGEKLLITGGGRCNITNNEIDNRKLLTKYKDASDFLHSPFAQFAVADTIKFFAELGLRMKEEPGGRMFPITNSARTVWEVLGAELARQGVSIQYNARVAELLKDGDHIASVRLDDGRVIKGDAFIIATGGTSRPETGSTGDGFKWLSSLGHTIHDSNPSLVPVKTLERWTHGMLGLAFEAAKVSLIRDKKVVAKKTGRILFTHFGLSGPLILNMSKEIWTLMMEDLITIEIDVFPKTDEGALDRMIQEKLQPLQNKLLRNALPEIFEKSLAEGVLEKLKLDGEKKVHQLTRAERLAIVGLVKHITLTPTGLLGTDKAIVTSGGLPLSEVEMRTMCSKRLANLFVTGDVLDIDRPSGGYSLQLCWTTGFVAGKSSVLYK
ncbi:MAG TPA: NAD(P)/FAD-dependent oxidoreductase [Candidatus Paceibacterota bacterium]|nr:NAD(P)/FAD-dependent oxidoreductase [Candidatus Paceibacterota bacterium]